MNSAIGGTQDLELHLIFLNFVDSMTVWHLKILAYLNHSLDYWKERYAFLREGDPDYEEVAMLIYPELRKEPDILEHILFDLSTSRLITPKFQASGTIIKRDEFGSLLTEMGKKFLEYISNPLNKNSTP